MSSDSSFDELIEQLGVDRSEFENLEIEELMAGSDVITLALLNAFFEPDVINKLDKEGKARAVGFEIAYRYITGMRIMAEKYESLQETKNALNKLL